MSLFPHRSGSTSIASEQPAVRVSLPGEVPIAGSPRLFARVVGCGAAVLSAALVLTACGTSPPAKTSTPAPKDDKVFHSTAEAKKAAVDASQRYWNAFIRAKNDPANAEKVLREVATDEVVKKNLKTIEDTNAEGKMVDGEVRVQSFAVRNSNFEKSAFRLSGIACIDYSHARIKDKQGNDVTNPDRPDVQAVESEFEPSQMDEDRLVIKIVGKSVDPQGVCSE